MTDFPEIRALTFDVFGTVVDWRSGIAREAENMLAPKGVTLDWGAFANAWRKPILAAMADPLEDADMCRRSPATGTCRRRPVRNQLTKNIFGACRRRALPIRSQCAK
jgi:hypothetical protein